VSIVTYFRSTIKKPTGPANGVFFAPPSNCPIWEEQGIAAHVTVTGKIIPLDLEDMEIDKTHLGARSRVAKARIIKAVEFVGNADVRIQLCCNARRFKRGRYSCPMRIALSI
jgi:hypothetical protein